MKKKIPLTVNERKNIERQRKRDAGFNKKETWVHETQLELFKKFTETLKKP